MGLQVHGSLHYLLLSCYPFNHLHDVFFLSSGSEFPAPFIFLPCNPVLVGAPLDYPVNRSRLGNPVLHGLNFCPDLYA